MDIPKIQIENEEIVLPTIEIPIMVNDKEEKIVLRKISAGKRKEILKKVIKTSVVGNQVQGEIDSASYQIVLLSNAIIQAPFKTDEKSLEKLGEEVIDYIFVKYEEFADASKKKD